MTNTELNGADPIAIMRKIVLGTGTELEQSYFKEWLAKSLTNKEEYSSYKLLWQMESTIAVQPETDPRAVQRIRQKMSAAEVLRRQRIFLASLSIILSELIIFLLLYF